MNNRLKTIGMIAVIVVFVIAACTFPTAQNNASSEEDRLFGLPTSVPEIIKEVVEEADSAAENTPAEPLMDAAQVPFMYYQQAEDFVKPYAEYIEGMVYTRAVDLAVIDIQDGTSTATRGHQFEGLITVKNYGFVSSPQVKLSCEAHGTYGLGGWSYVAPLSPGEEREYRIGFTGLEPGTYDYTCTVDSDNTLIEFNKMNNSMTTTINVTMTNTDLVITDVEDISAAPVLGYDHEYLITVQNVGPERSYKVLLRCSYLETLSLTREQIVWVGQMANAGDEVQVVCGFNSVPLGIYEVTMEVDWGNMIDESDEGNNVVRLPMIEP